MRQHEFGLTSCVAPLQPRRDGEMLLLKPSNLVLAVGTSVVVVGLTEVPELNNRKGIVAGFDEAKGRYKVRVKEEPRSKNLKPDNCRVDY